MIIHFIAGDFPLNILSAAKDHVFLEEEQIEALIKWVAYCFADQHWFSKVFVCFHLWNGSCSTNTLIGSSM